MKLGLLRLRQVRRLLLVCLVVGLWEVAYGQSASPSYSLTIQEQEKPAVAGSEVYITVTQTNTSKADVGCDSMSRGSTDLALRYYIKREDGTPLTQRANAYGYMTDISQCQLSPGESITRRYLLSWLFDLSVPGKYSVQVARHGEPYTEPQIMSNVITLVVVPAQAPGAEDKGEPKHTGK
ncbi:MAG TPA: hypothetical protein VF392_16100 [Terracidiphilus sp.]